MEKINELLSSSIFWFASVFIAFLISLIANFTKDWIEILRAKWSIVRQEKIESEDKELKEKIDLLKKNEQLQILYQNNIIYLKIRHVMYSLIQYFCLIFSLYSFSKSDFQTAIIFLIIALFMLLFCSRISKQIRVMASLINAALGSKHSFFLE